MHAYINGMDVWWILVIDLVMLVAGIIGVFLALILPEQYQFRGNLFLGGAFTALTGIAICFVMVRLTYSASEIDAGRHWKTECSLIEANVQTGFLNDAVNKLRCEGVIVNVPVNAYETYTEQWQLLQKKKGGE
ncbi:hypothetical protein ACHBI6_004630 [Klebsiella aerogenes]|nr:hypothetical protein [Klebsiella aerogenes]HEO1574523.1 hypothetical protein [Klebsiella aerogenes]